MPRIRTIKPEFCTSEQIVECSTNARLLFVLMWCFCDDAGRHPANVKRLKMEVYPGDAFTDSQISDFVSELMRAGLIVEYFHENKGYWQVTGWKKHQKIDRPSYKYPPFDEHGNPRAFDDHSTTIRRVLDDHSPPEGNGREGKGKEGKGKEGFSSNVPDGWILPEGWESPEVRAALEEWVGYRKRQGKPLFDLRLASGGLKEFDSPQSLIDAIKRAMLAGWVNIHPEAPRQRHRSVRGAHSGLDSGAKPQKNGEAESIDDLLGAISRKGGVTQ